LKKTENNNKHTGGKIPKKLNRRLKGSPSGGYKKK
tara:strand:+ start:1884 stop:1988 length:105 start_codon:yes stop_codon:yes gene_type:complete